MKKKNYLLCMLAIIFGLTKAQDVDFNFNLEEIPYSYYGAYTAISHLEKQGKITDHLYIRDVSGQKTRDAIFRIQVLGDNNLPVIPKYQANPASIIASNNDGQVEICYHDEKTIRIRGKNQGISLTFLPDIDNDKEAQTYTIPNMVPKTAKTFKLYRFWHNRFQFTILGGSYEINKKEPESEEINITILPKNGVFEIVLEEFQSEWTPREYNKSFDQCKIETATKFKAFYDQMPEIPSKYKERGIQAAYINWSSVVYPRELMGRYGMLMSKNWMHNIWSWDHCFNAMALSYQMPDLAFDQFMIMFDHQDATGAIPDAINDLHMLRGILKPPVHGWAFNKMMINGMSDIKYIAEAYAVLTKWTNFWLNHRDLDSNAVPEYNNGCDSGWDNATVYDIGQPTEGPDLSAFLVLQMDILSDMANKLNKKQEAVFWKNRADVLLENFIKRSWNGSQFVTKLVGTDLYNKESQSLINYLPIILGDRLPKEIRDKMISDLKNDGYFTAFGPATENPKNKLYEPDGYWRGPIWAPSTMIIIDGLKACGESDTAKELARKFCDMCNKNGFGENFDALTGESLRDPAYTWTTSVFLLLAHEYLN